MKIRNSFVSNSSSTSFTCSYCGNVESGWDYGLEECCMFECENNHIICQYHDKNWEEKKHNQEIINKEVEKWFDEEKEHMICFRKEYGFHIDDYKNKEDRDPTDEEVKERIVNGYKEGYIDSVPEEYCPLCNLTSISDHDLIWFLCDKFNIKREQVPQMIKDEFGTYKNFNKKIRKTYENKK